ncbi:Aldehyde dehydrogenase, partial [Colletotrichum gloeosporioides]
GLAAGLEGDVLQATGSKLHNLPACSCTSCERDLVNAGMAGQGGSGVTPVPVDDVDHSWREPRLSDQLRDIQHRQGRLLRQLQHDRVPASKRRTQLPGRHVEGVVPGDNLPADPQRLLDGVSQLIRADVHRLAVELVGPACVVPQHLGKVRDIDVAADRVRLPVVERLDGGQGLQVRINQVGQLHHHVAAFRPRNAFPRGMIKSSPRRCDSLVDILGRGSVHLADLFLIAAPT